MKSTQLIFISFLLLTSFGTNAQKIEDKINRLVASMTLNEKIGQMTQVERKELDDISDLAKYNIRVNSVCPTFVETPMVEEFFKDKNFKKSVIKNIPLGKVATESDIATAVVFLASEASAMMTGSSLVIDGGWTAK